MNGWDKSEMPKPLAEYLWHITIAAYCALSKTDDAILEQHEPHLNARYGINIRAGL